MFDAEPRLLQARRGRSLSYLGKTLLSLIDPIGHADRIALAVPRKEKTLYFCPSPLLGYGLETLKKVMSADSAILCVERDPKLMEVSRREIAREFIDAPRCALAHAVDPASVCALVRSRWGARAFRRIEMVPLSGGWLLAEREYRAMADALRADIAVNWSNAMTLVKLGRRYALNTMRNLALLPLSVPLERIRFENAPALILGAGPSMDGMADLLQGSAHRYSRGRPFKVVCVDTAFSALLARGIEVDLVIALEAQHWNLRDFVGTARSICPLVLDLSAHPGTAEVGCGPISLFFTPWTQLRFLDRLEAAGLLPPRLPPLGSVGLTAVAATLRLTHGTVVLAGLDFAYNLDAYHARSTPSRDDQLRKAYRLNGLINPAPAFRAHVSATLDKMGNRVRSDPALRGYRDLFLREFGATGRIVDAGTFGLDLGVPRMETEAALALLTADRNKDGGDSDTCRDRATSRGSGGDVPLYETIIAFIRAELGLLGRLRDALSGLTRPSVTEIEDLVDDCDYLWAHFPECAGADGIRPPLSDLSFLKRVRAEIDPFSKALTLALRRLTAETTTDSGPS